MTDISYR